MDERGQAITLEAVIAGMVLLSSLVFALQMTAVTPLSASTSSQHIENQLEASAEGVLAASVEDDSLKRAILYFNESAASFNNANFQGYYAGQPPDIEFGRTLEWAFDRRGIAYNIYLTYDVGGTDRERTMFYRGEPSDNAVSASTIVVLTDDDPLYEGTPTAEPRSVTVTDPNFYADDQSTGNRLFNVVKVEVVVWRI